MTCEARASIIKKLLHRWLPRVLFLCLLLICVLLSVFFLLRGSRFLDSGAASTLKTLVIDPGHGGIDGGAISDNGTKESDLNLAIALKLLALSDLFGQPVVMTRCDDSARTSYAQYSEHEDLVQRTELVNQTPGALLISIHQNDYPTSQPSGAQVLYASGSESETLGKLTHQNLVRFLDPQNRRVAEPAPRSLYMTKHVTCPAILVECGFMSNNYEVEKLSSDRYQKEIALVLIGSLLQFLDDAEIA